MVSLFFARYKHTLGALLFAVALIGGTYYFSSAIRRGPGNAAIVVADAPRSAQTPKDTDGDGMYDWEEDIAGTNPLVPNERPTSTIATTESARDFVPVTDTDHFSKSLFEDVLMAYEGDGTLTPEEQTRIVEKAAQEAAEQNKDRLFTRADIRTRPENDEETVRAYGNAIATIIANAQVPEENELDIVARALSAEDPSELEKLDLIIAAYKQMLLQLGAERVPTPLANEHLMLLNALFALHNDITAMRNIFEDGLPGLVRVRRYESDVDALISAFTSLRYSFESRGIYYTETEPGILFYEATQ